MAAVQHRRDASEQIDVYINELPDWSRKICVKLRSIVLKSSAKLIEDWKWGPNYYFEGMVCGYAAFKQHVSFVFFQGALLKDAEKVLMKNPGNLHNRHIKFKDVKEIDGALISRYLKEAMANNAAGKKMLQPEKKNITLHPAFHAALVKGKLLSKFETYTYYKRKELSEWINAAKREETRDRRIAEAIIQVKEGKSINDKYRK